MISDLKKLCDLWSISFNLPFIIIIVDGVNGNCDVVKIVILTKLNTIAPEKHFAFRGLAISLRRTGRASADVVTGRDGLSLPLSQNRSLRGLIVYAFLQEFPCFFTLICYLSTMFESLYLLLPNRISVEEIFVGYGS